ncbi:hypothetical protein FPZ12_028710 [Amycolatopsis acidicola]|uniref:Uncharacterized protein n=1 Tax=Amycolatopsis acidicola TaxID=2596893 RepID=A0A5N0UXL7_9PSEU|nr:hypothetical protein [Amycolatopsis acidicola]KAA9155906.1 hypothetical protein FPZ12_028710 [Amycolatopsis acidicola]
MSDEILKIVPTNPYWQPHPDDAASLVELVRTFAREAHIEEYWHQAVEFMDCGSNLAAVGCPHCGARIEFREWDDLMTSRYDNGFTTLEVEVPCCGSESTLNALDYHWPCAFGRFAVELRNPGRAGFTDEELIELARALGHPVLQVRARL